MASEKVQGSVLAVDDDQGISRLINDKLCAEGFSCMSCSSAEEALAALATKTFDIIITDLQMPGMSGLQLIEEARNQHSRSAYLVITGVDDIHVAIDAMKRGADDYLVKPFRLDALVSSVERALHKKRLELEVEKYRKSLEEMVEKRTSQLRAAMKRIELTYDDTLEALGAALDLRDNETGGHSRRVSHYCLEIAKAYGCTPEQLKQTARGSYMHDIGKIGIPDSILLKPGKLTREERATMETHARIGYELVSRIVFLAGAAEIVLAHQERYDGTGYPQGLVGEEIPLGARIFAVADTLDAMTSDRPYRRAMSFAKARAEIKNESGHQFDPDVVRVFLAIPESTWQEIRFRSASSRAISRPRNATPTDTPLAA
ncbi:MAG TPA: HD domain-containing phosphohydrolase [Terriglobia bacterium]|nr:HD domain-containing phosphohydrolase [Terriglobia bacterium]